MQRNLPIESLVEAAFALLLLSFLITFWAFTTLDMLGSFGELAFLLLLFLQWLQGIGKGRC